MNIIDKNKEITYNNKEETNNNINTTPIYEVLRNRYLVKKIISSTSKRLLIRVNNYDKWRWNYNHWQTLSSLVDSPYHSLILDKIKSNSLVITNQCIDSLVMCVDFDFQLFKTIYELKQWMFTNPMLLFSAIQSGSLDRVKLLSAQEYPIRFSRQRNDGSKTSIIEHAFNTSQFHIYRYLLYQSKEKDNSSTELLKDLTPSVKAKILLTTVLNHKDLSYLEMVANSSNNKDDEVNKIDNNHNSSNNENEMHELYLVKQEISKLNPHLYSKMLLIREGGLYLVKIFFPKHICKPDTTLEYFFQRYQGNYSQYTLDVMKFLALGRSPPKTANLDVNSIEQDVRDRLKKSYNTIIEKGVHIDSSILDKLDRLVLLMTLYYCIVQVYRQWRCPWDMDEFYRRFSIELIQNCDIIGLPVMLTMGLSPYSQVLHIIRLGTVEQIHFAISYQFKDVIYNDWFRGAMINRNPDILNYFLETYGMDAMVEGINPNDTNRLVSIDTPERLKVVLNTDPQLRYVVSKIRPTVITKDFLLELAMAAKREPFFLQVTQFDDAVLNHNDLESIFDIIRILITGDCKVFSTFKNQILLAALRSLNYQIISLFLENKEGLENIDMKEVIKQIGIQGDPQLLDLFINHITNGQLQSIVNTAYSNGCLAIIDHCKLKYMDNREVSLTELPVAVVTSGRLDIIKYYIQQQQDNTFILELLNQSIVQGQLDIFKHLIDNIFITKKEHFDHIINQQFTESCIRSILDSKYSIPILNYAVGIGCKLDITDKILNNRIVVKNNKLCEILNKYNNKN